MHWTIPILLSAVLVASGCAGPAQEKAIEEPPSDVVVRPGENLEDGASLRGLVLDDSEAPLAGAVVALMELDVQALTGETGGYQFSNLPSGPVTIQVAKLGFEATARRIDLPANEETIATFLLKPVAIDVVYHETNGPYAGFFTCKMGLPTQSAACGSVLLISFRTDDLLWGGDKAFQWWNLTSDDYRTIVGELQWQPATFASSKKLRSSFDHERFGSHWFCGQEGPGPIVYRYERLEPDEIPACGGNSASASAAPLMPAYGKPLVTGFRVPFGSTSASDPSPVYLAFQQKVTSAMSVFYGDVAPNGWLALPDS